MKVMEKLFLNKSDDEIYKVFFDFKNKKDYKLAIKTLKRLKDKKNAKYFYYLALCYFYLFDERKANKILKNAFNFEFSNKEKNEITALQESINSSLFKPAKVLELYSNDEIDKVKTHIETYFGQSEIILKEMMALDIHVNIHVIPPTKDKDYYTLVTCGMGAHKMNVPSELVEENLNRAELVLYLPSYWQIDSDLEKWYWPLRWLKILARLPIEHNSWLGGFHTVPNGGSFHSNTELSGMILIDPQNVSKDSFVCKFNDEVINFYQIFPLYENEMNYKLEYGADALFSFMPYVSSVVDLKRKNAFDIYFENVIDCAYNHADKIKELNLDTDLLNACNHLVIYLRWCFENNLLNDNFKNSCLKIDINDLIAFRNFFHESLIGDLTYYMFNDEGKNFTDFFFIFDDPNGFPAYIDNYALNYFGEEKYNCKEFKDEAYLFVPLNDDYYFSLKKVLDKNYEIFKNNKN